jgi:hypothetical protein
MIRQYWISDGDMSRSPLAKPKFAPVPKTTRHVLLDPCPFFVLVVKSRDSRHLDLACLVASPYPLEGVIIEILLVGGTRCRDDGLGLFASRP